MDATELFVVEKIIPDYADWITKNGSSRFSLREFYIHQTKKYINYVPTSPEDAALIRHVLILLSENIVNL
jgi:hypothetical protein